VAGYLKPHQKLYGKISDAVDVTEHCSPEKENIWSMNVISVICKFKVDQTGNAYYYDSIARKMENTRTHSHRQ
jgi:hypothetical protein